MENDLAVPYKTKGLVPGNPAIPFLDKYLPQRNENICLHKDLYMNVHSNFIHNNQDEGISIGQSMIPGVHQ